MRYIHLSKYLRGSLEPNFTMDDNRRFILSITHFKLADTCDVERWNNLKSHVDFEFIHNFKSMVGKFKQLKNK